MLNHVVQPLIAEEAARFDPQIETAKPPYGVGFTGLLRELVLWRESAWRQAELLVSAPNDAARVDLAQSLKEAAAANARAIVTATGYLSASTSTRARDQYCFEHSNQGN